MNESQKAWKRNLGESSNLRSAFSSIFRENRGGYLAGKQHASEGEANENSNDEEKRNNGFCFGSWKT